MTGHGTPRCNLRLPHLATRVLKSQAATQIVIAPASYTNFIRRRSVLCPSPKVMAHAILIALAGLGALVAVQFARSTYQFVAFHFFLPTQPLSAYRRPGAAGTYALVTGSSAGIGLGIAQELVRQSFNIILHGYLADELAEAAATLREIAPTAKVQTLILDASKATPTQMESAVASLAGFPLSVLVNNVGGNACALPPLRPLATYSLADVDAVVNQNALFMARLTALVLPLLARRRPEALPGTERSLVLTVSSAGRVGVPWIVTYGASKAFNWALSVGLARELPEDPRTAHIDALCVVPGEVRSQGNSQGVPLREPAWDEFGRNIVWKADTAIGFGWREMMPHWRHHLELALLDRLPESIRTVGVMDQIRVKKEAWDKYYSKNR